MISHIDHHSCIPFLVTLMEFQGDSCQKDQKGGGGGGGVCKLSDCILSKHIRMLYSNKTVHNSNKRGKKKKKYVP